MNLLILLLFIVTAIFSPSFGLGVLTGICVIYIIWPKYVIDKFTHWSWMDWRV